MPSPTRPARPATPTSQTRPARIVSAAWLAAALLPLALLSAGCIPTDSHQPAGGPGVATSPPERSPGASAAATPTSPPVPSATATGGTPGQRTIVIDPGHSGRSIRRVDSTGLNDIDYPNYPEIYEAYDVSACLAESLRADGYRVLLTKADALSTVSHRRRARIADRAQADLAISIHDDHGVGPRFEATYSQRGARRSDGTHPVMYRGTGRHRTVFALPGVARRSDAAARAIARARATAQHRHVSVTQNSFDGREPLEPGNLALVQLFATVPWVYNEMGARTAGSTTRAMSIASERGYAAGILAGVEAAVPPASGQAGPRSPSAGTLTRCLRRRVEPEPGTLTRPKRYLPDGF